MIAIIDYGMGNIASVSNAFKYLGFDTCVTNDRLKIRNATHLVLPGVGAAADAMKLLKNQGLNDAIYEHERSGKPFMGICLGMQLMFRKSYENGEHECLGIIPGRVVPFSRNIQNLRIPHMGWNNINMRNTKVFEGMEKNTHMYFVHSYYVTDVPDNYIIGETDYGVNFICAVQKNNLIGLQFHPEKSGAQGLQILKNFGGKM